LISRQRREPSYACSGLCISSLKHPSDEFSRPMAVCEKGYEMRLHLGCGDNILDGWMNIDIGSDDPRVIHCDVSNLDQIVGDGSASEIYACHVLEHIPRGLQVPVLAHWLGKLRPSGVCYIAVPDFNYLVTEYVRALAEGEQWWDSEKAIISSLMGGYADGSHDEHNHHKSLFDLQYLAYLMTTAGFVGVRRYQPLDLGFDPHDHSTRPLSLNVMGIRSEKKVGRVVGTLSRLTGRKEG